MRNKEGAFNIYKGSCELELVGYTTCGGCPGGNIEYAPEEMIKNGAEVIHFATGFVVGYPPCPHIIHFKKFIEEKFGVKVVIGTHPIPQKYYLIHSNLDTWNSDEWIEIIQPTLVDEQSRLAYN
jgi:predicted metal-binding protein